MLLFKIIILSMAALAHGADNKTEPVYFQTSFKCPKFDCATEQYSTVEYLICKSRSLADLDREMATTYESRISKAQPSEKKQIKENQKAWLNFRNGFGGTLCDSNLVAMREQFEEKTEKEAISDLEDLYKEHIKQLKSGPVEKLAPIFPNDYSEIMKLADWEIGMWRALMGCESACKQELHRYKALGLSVDLNPLKPAEISVQKIEQTFVKLGWKNCGKQYEGADGKLTGFVFTKGDRIASVENSWSMSQGSSIAVSMSMSGPELRHPIKEKTDNPVVTITADWKTFDAGGGIHFRMPKDWVLKKENKTLWFHNPKNSNFVFGVTVAPKDSDEAGADESPSCSEGEKSVQAKYQIAGAPATECRNEFEDALQRCGRTLSKIWAVSGQNLIVLNFVNESPIFNSGPEPFKLKDFYEKIISTMKIEKH